MEQTIYLQAADAVAIASLAAFTANPKDLAPVLSEIAVTVQGSQLTATGTDRFTLAEYRAELTGQYTEPVTFRLSAAAAKFITANVKKLNKWREPGTVTFIVDQEERAVTISYGDATLRDAWTAANYPRVNELLGNWQPASDNKPVKLGSAFLARLGKLVEAFAKVDYWVLQTGYAGEFGESKGRPGPVLATAGNFRVLIQPNVYNPADTI